MPSPSLLLETLAVINKKKNMTKKPNRIGKLRVRIKGIDLGREYLNLAREDKKAADELIKLKCYRPAAYLIIQSMEKLLRYKIFSKVNGEKKYYRDKNKNHNITSGIDFLIEIIAFDDLTKQAIRKQLDENVLKGRMLRNLNNSLRYPQYSEKYNSFSVLELSRKDIEHLLQIHKALVNYLDTL